MSDVRVRDAMDRDLDALSHLLVQLYAHELPGMFKGDIHTQAQLARAVLTATGLNGGYVLERNGDIVAMGNLATHEQPRPKPPARTVLRAPRIAGPLNGTRTMFAAARGLLTIADPPQRNEGQIHSLVVDDTHRGHGLGTIILKHLEQEAARRGKHHVVLQVITSNTTARAFYKSAGYTESQANPRPICRGLVFPSHIMHKAL